MRYLTHYQFKYKNDNHDDNTKQSTCDEMHIINQTQR
jgi:hypothetical protein